MGKAFLCGPYKSLAALSITHTTVALDLILAIESPHEQRYDDKVSTNGICRRHVASSRHDREQQIKRNVQLCTCITLKWLNPADHMLQSPVKEDDLYQIADLKDDFIPFPLSNPPLRSPSPNSTLSESAAVGLDPGPLVLLYCARRCRKWYE